MPSYTGVMDSYDELSYAWSVHSQIGTCNHIGRRKILACCAHTYDVPS